MKQNTRVHFSNEGYYNHKIGGILPHRLKTHQQKMRNFCSDPSIRSLFFFLWKNYSFETFSQAATEEISPTV